MGGVLDKLKKEISKEALERVTPLLDEIKITNKTLKEINKNLKELLKYIKEIEYNVRVKNGK